MYPKVRKRIAAEPQGRSLVIILRGAGRAPALSTLLLLADQILLPVRVQIVIRRVVLVSLVVSA